MTALSCMMKSLSVCLVGVCLAVGAYALPNPSSVFCGDQGWLGVSGISSDESAQGSVSYCLLPDGSYFEEWDLFRGADNRYASVVKANSGHSTLEQLQRQRRENERVNLARQGHILEVLQLSRHEGAKDTGFEQLVMERSQAFQFCQKNGWIFAPTYDEPIVLEGGFRIYGDAYCLLPDGHYYEGWDLWLGRDSVYKDLIERYSGQSTYEYIEIQRALTHGQGE